MALRVRCWRGMSAELCIDHLLEERCEVSADTSVQRGGESTPELGWVTGQNTSHCSTREMSSVMACEVSVDRSSDSGRGESTFVATWGIRSTMVSR